jgi:maltooligosyltrehalose synthase
LIVVPRWTFRLTAGQHLPLGGSVWADTHLLLPKDLPSTWRDIFTGETRQATVSGDAPVLAVGDLLSRFPIALLTADTPANEPVRPA